jgi:hypothetical protein
MNLIAMMFKNIILLGFLFLLGGAVFSKRGRGGSFSLVGGISLLIGLYLVIKGLSQIIF